MVSLLGKWNYKFPQPMPLERKLKDYLEDEVGEKYYINNEKAQKLIQKLIKNGTLRNDNGVMEKISVDLSINNPRKKAVSNCITARDMGISNKQSVGNGVVKWKKEVLGSVYCKTSEEFMRGICSIARTIKAEQHDLAVVEMKERRLGNITTQTV